MAKSKLVEMNKKIEETVVGSYKKIEETVVDSYKKIEDGAVNGFHKVSDKFVDNFLTKEGETVADAKNRLVREQKGREEAVKADMEKRQQVQQDIIKASVERSKNAGLK